MQQYRVYRAGEDEPAETSGRKSASPLAPSTRSQRPRDPAYLTIAVIVTLLCAAAALAVLYGHQVYGDLTGVVGFAGHLRRLPHWSRLVIPAAAVLLFALVTWYLAFGRHVAAKVVGLALLVAVLAAPGFAFGYVDHDLNVMGSGGTAEQRATVAKARTVLAHPLPDMPMNILLLGTDASHNADSQILVRLDPQAKTISMLSLPRDLYTDIPGVGYAKMNAAYADGGVKLAVQTFSNITGLPIDHFIRVDFNGFWKVVDLLGGVYLPIDHRYYNPPDSGFKSIDLQPGYQLVDAKQSLNFVRFRHDQSGDFTRMVRQQMFLREVQRQATRWSGSWTKVVKMVHAISKLTTTDLDSLAQILPVVNMALTLNTAHIYQVHVEGTTPVIGGVDYVVATQTQIAQAVYQFEQPPGPHSGGGAASASASPAPSPSSSASPSSLASPSPTNSSAKHGGYDWSAWRTLARRTSLTLEAPTTWAAALGYDTAGVPFRAYTVETPQNRHVEAAIAVGTITGGSWGATEYWGVQALAWNDPPAIADPNSTRTVKGRTYLLFYQDKNLHMVAWHENGDTYWVINTLDNVLSNHLMMKLAESCRPVGA
jgi:LCP family protein required for cell wall assembly